MRQEITDFTEGMQRQLDAHPQHGDAWKEMRPTDILAYLIGDLGKLAYFIRCTLYKGGALRPDPEQDWSLFKDQVREMAYDVGNLAMMIADRVGILSGEDTDANR